MAHRRISSAEKGKGIDLGSHQPPRAARVLAPLPDNSELLRKHSLTLIGRVTNKTAQKVWSLIPFFTEHWKTEFKPVGADLGNGLFQFQFELESDLVSVLEQRPYHYARWMVIIQRWEPTISPSFPSLIPFWIKVQGLPVHLWTEPIIKAIGANIGIYEKAEITTLTARMRVHIDGLLPLITNSVVDFPNGDEVTATLVYERLDKHCSKCKKLDHEVKECLVARAEARAMKPPQEELGDNRAMAPVAEVGDNRGFSVAPTQSNLNGQDKSTRSEAAFRFSATDKNEGHRRRTESDHRNVSAHRQHKSQSNYWQERGANRRSSQAKERSRYEYERGSRQPQEYSRRHLPGPPSKSYYREVTRRSPAPRDNGSEVSKVHHETENKGNPKDISPRAIPEEVMQEARKELQNYMSQYASHPDPIEREARKERMRQTVELGEMEETATQMARTSLENANRQNLRQEMATPERLPATQRLGTSTQKAVELTEKSHSGRSHSHERVPASQRLGPLPPLLPLHDEDIEPNDDLLLEDTERLPATLRLGPPVPLPLERETDEQAKASKRKPGRPPGSKSQNQTCTPADPATKVRRVTQSKGSPLRRKTTPKLASAGNPKPRTGTSKRRNQTASASSSDNRPLCNMIPASTRKRMDFRIQPSLGP